ncbi:MAG: HAMP domain-containing histidine kinase [bacterium]|nr:HAMP domain-containing histidine kinase [bacterium]
MNERRYRSLSTRGPVILFVIVLVLIVTLTVLWHVALVQDYQKLKALAAQDSAFHWTFIALGSVLFLAIIVLASILGSQLIGHIRWSQRQSNFVASVSHELNSPLSAIKLFAQTLRRRDLATEDRLDFVEKILFDVERLQRLISNILRAAEVDNRGDELHVVVQSVELTSYLREYIRDATALNEESNLRLALSGGGELPVKLDRMMFRQVLDNLIDNAIRYRGPEAPEVEMRLARVDGWAELRVVDRGIGVSATELPHLFDRFYRSDKSAPVRQRKGTGIGLFVVRSIVEAHGGKVRAFSDGLGRGTTISIRLPSPLVRAEVVDAAELPLTVKT